MPGQYVFMEQKKKIKKKKLILIQLFLAFVAIISLIFLASEFKSEKSIKLITVSGNNIVSSNEIIEKLCLPVLDSLGDKTGLEDIQTAVNSHPFIKFSTVVRESSEEVNVEVNEYLPVAVLVDTNGYLKYIDREARILPYNYAEKFRDLMIFSGLCGYENDSLVMKEALLILNELRKEGREELYSSINEIHFDTLQQTFVLYTGGTDLKIIFGNHLNAENKIRKLMSFWKTEMAKLDRQKINYIDLRWAHQLVLNLT